MGPRGEKKCAVKKDRRKPCLVRKLKQKGRTKSKQKQELEKLVTHVNAMRRATERLEEEAQRREKAKDQSEATPRKSVVSNVTYSPEKVAPPGDREWRAAFAKQQLQMESLLCRIANHQAGLLLSRLIQFNTGRNPTQGTSPRNQTLNLHFKARN